MYKIKAINSPSVTSVVVAAWIPPHQISSPIEIADKISTIGKNIIEKNGDDSEIDWVHKSERFYEKLATPDVTVSDLSLIHI